MIDIRELRRDPEAYIARLARKGADQLGRELLEVDAAWRTGTAQAEALRAAQKRAGKPMPDDLQNLAQKGTVSAGSGGAGRARTPTK